MPSHTAGDRGVSRKGARGKGLPVDRRWLWALGGIAAVALVVFALWLGPWLFTRHPDHALTPDQELKAKNDVRTTLVQVLGGLVVAGGAVVTYQTFRQNQADQVKRWELQDSTFAQTQLDQAKRWEEQERTFALSKSQQLTETYAKGVEQLGDEAAPVRLGAMYSLARLAQDTVELRQTVVDVLCAYLRMPYTPPAQEEPVADHDKDAPVAVTEPTSASVARHDPAQELQVRQTAQQLLADHLRRPANTSGEDAQRLKASPELAFWPEISLDLRGATLVDLDLRGTSAVNTVCNKATFSGDAWFVGATFSGDALFRKAAFSGPAGFVGATFSGPAWFNEATFSGTAGFNGATFSGTAGFNGATFSGDAEFIGATFSGDAEFNAATFSDDAWFNGARFSGLAWFNAATFSHDAEFTGATFSGDAWFNVAIFSEDAWFVGATFSGDALFRKATFSGAAGFGGVLVLRLDDADLNEAAHRVWPDGWIVRPDADDPTRGTLVPMVAEGDN